MNETSPVQRQDITPLYRKLDKIIELLQELVDKVIGKKE